MTKNELKDNSWGGEGHNNNKRKSYKKIDILLKKNPFAATAQVQRDAEELRRKIFRTQGRKHAHIHEIKHKT